MGYNKDQTIQNLHLLDGNQKSLICWLNAQQVVKVKVP